MSGEAEKKSGTPGSPIRVESPSNRMSPAGMSGSVAAKMSKIDASSPSSMTDHVPGMSEEMVQILINEQLDLRLDEMDNRVT